MTPDEIAKRCEARGARVIRDGHNFKVYPGDPSKPPLSFSALHIGTRGAGRANLLSDLRKRGIDVLADTPADQPPVITKKEPTVAAPTEPTRPPAEDRTNIRGNGDSPYVQRPTVVPFDYRKAYEDLKGQLSILARRLEESETTVAGLVAGLDTKVTEMDGRLETVAPRPKPKPLSVSALCRREVLAFLEEHPGLKWSPSAIEGNISDRLPANRAKTSVALALQALAKAGKIQGGARGISETMGLYWLEPKKD
jgi:hypothetical protein